MNLALLLTCEHASARIPAGYEALFASTTARRALRSHRGSDRGAFGLARSLAHAFGAPLLAGEVSRLLVDLNRSVGHPALFSPFTRKLDAAEREILLEAHYYPHRRRVEQRVAAELGRRHVAVHIGVHSFAPRVGGHVRTADVGLLYDPSRGLEKCFCAAWKAAFSSFDTKLRVRRNYPFLGRADGLVTHLRRVFGPEDYLGIELEVNEALLLSAAKRPRISAAIRQSLHQTLRSL